MKKDKQISELKEKIREWNKAYFIDNKPLVSDRVYDTNIKILEELENSNNKNIADDSPTQIIGDYASSKFKKHNHKKKMLSLAKAYSHVELNKFVNDITKKTKLKHPSFYIEPKIDGLSISLIYDNGSLIKAVTRGDGSIGEDVTDNVFGIIEDIPKTIKYKGIIEIRGEIYLTISTFDKLVNSGENFSNPRNAASGTLRQLDKKIVKKRNLSCFVYEIINYEQIGFKKFNETINFLKENNFKIQENHLLSNNIDEIFKFIDDISKKRNELDYEIDGLVVKMNDINFNKELGYTSKFPKYNIAYKFDDEVVTSKILNIFVTVGRTGNVTYNASLEKVLLKGSIISFATLHNFNYIKSINLNINDEVEIKKAGEIIPKVIRVIRKKSNGVFPIVKNCPFCNSELVFNESKIEQFCLNENCDERQIRKIIHFSSRQATNIEHLGEKWVRIFYENKIIKEISDIYLLKDKKEEILKLERIGEKSFRNLIDSIEETKSISLPKLIFSLGIEKMGERNSKILSKIIKEFKNIIDFDFDSLIEINDIGPLTIESLKKYFENEKNIKIINRLIELGLNPTYDEIINETIFKNKKIAITGSFDISRELIKKAIEKIGAIYSSSISKKTDYLICGKNSGTKKEKAINLGVEFLEVDDIMEFK